MKMIDTKCPGCGAQMTVDRANGHAYCEYCGTVLLIDDENARPAPKKKQPSSEVSFESEEARMLYEKGRERARREAEEQAKKEEQLNLERQRRLKEAEEAHRRAVEKNEVVYKMETLQDDSPIFQDEDPNADRTAAAKKDGPFIGRIKRLIQAPLRLILTIFYLLIFFLAPCCWLIRAGHYSAFSLDGYGLLCVVLTVAAFLNVLWMFFYEEVYESVNDWLDYNCMFQLSEELFGAVCYVLWIIGVFVSFYFCLLLANVS